MKQTETGIYIPQAEDMEEILETKTEYMGIVDARGNPIAKVTEAGVPRYSSIPLAKEGRIYLPGEDQIGLIEEPEEPEQEIVKKPFKLPPWARRTIKCGSAAAASLILMAVGADDASAQGYSINGLVDSNGDYSTWGTASGDNIAAGVGYDSDGVASASVRPKIELGDTSWIAPQLTVNGRSGHQAAELNTHFGIDNFLATGLLGLDGLAYGGLHAQNAWDVMDDLQLGIGLLANFKEDDKPFSEMFVTAKYDDHRLTGIIGQDGSIMGIARANIDDFGARLMGIHKAGTPNTYWQLLLGQDLKMVGAIPEIFRWSDTTGSKLRNPTNFVLNNCPTLDCNTGEWAIKLDYFGNHRGGNLGLEGAVHLPLLDDAHVGGRMDVEMSEGGIAVARSVVSAGGAYGPVLFRVEGGAQDGEFVGNAYLGLVLD